MFDFVRKHNKLMMGVLFLLIVPSFVLLGLNDYGQPGAKTVVAQVDGREITQAEWDAAHRNEVDRLRAAMPTLDIKLLDSPEARYATLESLVRERVLRAAANRLHLGASNQRVAQELQNDPQIAMLRKPDGTLDMERYQQLLRAQGMSPEAFEAGVRADLSSRQMLQAVAGTSVASPAVADTALGAYFEKRSVKLARFSPAEYAARLQPTDADLEQYHQANARQFTLPETAQVEYVVLDSDAVARTLVPSDAELRSFYEQNAQRLAGKEERRASHILINAPQAAAKAEREAARTKAAGLLADLRKSPERFAATARQHSQDAGSAAAGGDLGFFARGAMVKPFEDAAFALKQGEISELVETEFGFHIIRVTEVKQPKARSFEDMKPELAAEFRKQQLTKKYAEAAEQFTNGVYEQPDSLKPTADKLKLQVQVAAGVTREAAPNAKGPLANAKVLAAIFSADALEKKRNTEAIDIGGGSLVAARVVQHTPARVLPVAEVREQVKARWLATRSAEEARKEGEAKLAAWKAKPEEAKLPESLTVSRADARSLPQSLIDAALRADPAALPQFTGVDLGAQGYAVLKVEQVLPREQRDENQTRAARNQYREWWASAEGLAYYKWLQQRLKAEIKAPKPTPQVTAKA